MCLGADLVVDLGPSQYLRLFWRNDGVSALASVSSLASCHLVLLHVIVSAVIPPFILLFICLSSVHVRRNGKNLTYTSSRNQISLGAWETIHPSIFYTTFYIKVMVVIGWAGRPTHPCPPQLLPTHLRGSPAAPRPTGRFRITGTCSKARWVGF